MMRSVLGLVRRSVASTSSGEYSGGVQTAILFTHHGRPTNYEEANELIESTAIHRYRVLPAEVSRWFSRSWIALGAGQSIETAFDKDKRAVDGRSDDANMCRGVSTALDELLPEHAPFAVDIAYSLHTPNVHTALRGIHKRSPSRVLFIPLHPHYYCFTHQLAIDDIYDQLNATTMPVEGSAVRRVIRADEEFDAMAGGCRYELIDRMNNHPILADVFSNKIKQVLAEQMPSDVHPEVVPGQTGVVFVAARHRHFNAAQYRLDVQATCSRTIEQLDNSLPYQVAFNRWAYQPSLLRHDFWSNNVLRAIRRLTRNNVRNIIVLPVDQLGGDAWTIQPTVDLLTPNVLRLLGCEQVHICSPGRTSDKNVITGLTELARNHLLHPNTRRPHAMWKLRCRHCHRRSCRRSRKMFGTAT